MKEALKLVLRSSSEKQLNISVQDNLEYPVCISSEAFGRNNLLPLPEEISALHANQQSRGEVIYDTSDYFYTVIEFFSDMRSFQEIEISVTFNDCCYHTIRMSTQASVMRLLPFLFSSHKYQMTEMPMTHYTISTDSFLKGGWLAQELNFIISNEILYRTNEIQRATILKRIKAVFKKKSAILHVLHKDLSIMISGCNPIKNGLSTAIMCVDSILLNPMLMIEKFMSVNKCHKAL